MLSKFLQIRVDPRLHRAVKVLAAVQGLTISGIVRDLLLEYLEAQGFSPSDLVTIEDDLQERSDLPQV